MNQRGTITTVNNHNTPADVVLLLLPIHLISRLVVNVDIYSGDVVIIIQ